MASRVVTLGHFVAQQMEKQQHSNRSLAAAAGISEGAVRNILKYGSDANARDPDARTLSAIAQALSVDPAILFKLAGYLPAKPDIQSARATFVANVFDRLNAEKQEAVLGVIDAMAGDKQVTETVQSIRADADNPLAGFDLHAPNLIRIIANLLIVEYQMTEEPDLARIQPDVQLLQYKWRDLPQSTQKRIIGLIRHKLALDYDPTMVDPEWRD